MLCVSKLCSSSSYIFHLSESQNHSTLKKQETKTKRHNTNKQQQQKKPYESDLIFPMPCPPTFNQVQ